MIEFSKPIHKTNIIPLRWFANTCNHISSKFLRNAVYLDYICDDENIPLGFKYKFSIFMYELIDKPYKKWGTTYELNMNAWRRDIWGDKNVD